MIKAKAALDDLVSQGAQNLGAKLAAATGLDTDPPRGAEIRAGVRAVSAGERLKVLNNAFKADDREVLRSMLQGPAFLSGLPEQQQKAMREAYQDQVAPDVVADVDALFSINSEVKIILGVAEKAALEAMAPDVVRGILEAEGRATAAQARLAQAFEPMPITGLN